ncbi:YadA C-terminal domain-containing protein [Pelistega europaea]|uniref:Trimeric autotransporter adhesin YadA-like C-terminal membrane anchor domain-containing protein n=1 Tax=Pelistega europaea TaxID=106147 RepID=A0A7Y4L978_9BURK|nr:YadA-like family protein [Pelistega europaea]NOL49248.1 hypothetical protein [Pelistega europaea]
MIFNRKKLWVLIGFSCVGAVYTNALAEEGGVHYATRVTYNAERNAIEVQRCDESTGFCRVIHTAGGGNSAEITRLTGRASDLEERANALESRTVDVVNRTSSLEMKTNNLGERTAGLENKTQGLEGRTLTLEDKTQGLEGRTLTLEDKTQGLEGRTLTLEDKTQSLEGRTLTLEDKTQGLEGRTLTLEDKTQGLEGRTLTLEDKTQGLEGRTLTLEDKTQGLEGRAMVLEGRADTTDRSINDIVTHLGGGAMLNNDGTVIPPTYTIQDIATATEINHRDVGSAIGAVQTNVNYVMDTSKALIRANAEDLAQHLGGGATVGDDGRVTAPQYVVTDSKTGQKKTHSTVAGAISALDANMGVAAQDTANYLGGGASVTADGRVNAPVYTIKDLNSGKQMKLRDVGSALQALQKNTQFVRKEGFAGTASAMAVAGLGQSFRPGQTSLGLSSAIYKGQVGYALGASYMADNGKLMVKGAINHNSQGNLGAVVGATYYFD